MVQQIPYAAVWCALNALLLAAAVVHTQRAGCVGHEAKAVYRPKVILEEGLQQLEHHDDVAAMHLNVGRATYADATVEEAEDPKAQYLLIGVVPQQFTSALQQGLARFMKVAALSNRTAVMPQARFGSSAFRLVLRPARSDKYFDLSRFIDEDQYFAPVSCIRRTSGSAWAAATDKHVDLLLHIQEPGQSCLAPRWSKVLRSQPNYGAYHGSVRKIDYYETFVDTIKGRVSVAKVECIAGDASPETFLEKTTGLKSVMITTPEQDFMGHGMPPLCDNHLPDFPAVARPFADLAQRVRDNHLGTEAYGCVHLRVEKLLRGMLTSGTWEWGQDADGAPTSAPLEKCLQGALELSAMIGEYSGGHLFLMHDMQKDLGTVSAHFDGKIDARAYARWSTWAEQAVAAALPEAVGYCGSADSSFDAATDTPVGEVLSANPRACSLVDAAVCVGARRRMRMGDGSFGAFATHILTSAAPVDGPEEFAYESCEQIQDAAARCKAAGKCRTIPLRP